LTKGDILVINSTNVDITQYIIKAEGIVVESGGITSHAAIVAREFNIPCIVGVKEATSFIKNGDFVKMNVNEVIVENGKKSDFDIIEGTFDVEKAKFKRIPNSKNITLYISKGNFIFIYLGPDMKPSEIVGLFKGKKITFIRSINEGLEYRYCFENLVKDKDLAHDCKESCDKIMNIDAGKLQEVYDYNMSKGLELRLKVRSMFENGKSIQELVDQMFLIMKSRNYYNIPTIIIFEGYALEALNNHLSHFLISQNMDLNEFMTKLDSGYDFSSFTDTSVKKAVLFYTKLKKLKNVEDKPDEAGDISDDVTACLESKTGMKIKDYSSTLVWLEAIMKKYKIKSKHVI
jgi:phosphohistidine swiveling domain-containing protein